MALFRSVFIVAAKRTPFGTFGGKLKNTGATQLAIAASKSAIQAGKIPPEHIDTVVMGNVIQVSSENSQSCHIFEGVKFQIAHFRNFENK